MRLPTTSVLAGVAVALLVGGATALTAAEIAKEGDTLLAGGDARGAVEAFDKALRLDKANYLYLFKRATAYLSIGRDRQALADFEDILVIKPDFEQALKGSARIYLKRGEFDRARDRVTKLAGSQNQDMVAKIQLAEKAAGEAEAARMAGEWEKCTEAATDALAVASNSAGLRDLRIECALSNRDYRKALVDLAHVAQLRPQDTATYARAARIHYWKYHEYEAATKQIHRCTQFDPDSRECRDASSAIRKWERRLKPYLAVGRKGKASGHKLWAELEAELVQQGLLDELRAAANAELGLAGAVPAPDEALDVTADLGDGLCEAYYNLKRYADGAAWCDEAIARDPDFVPAILLSAEREIEAEHFENAGRILSDAQRLGNARINNRLRDVRGMIYRSQHKDYYGILGVKPDATDREIKSAHRAKSREYHPDKYQGELDADQVMDKMAEINEAYEVLSDDEKRRQYDNAQAAGAAGFGGGHPHQHGHPFGGGGAQFAGFDFAAFQEQFMKQHFRGR